MMCVVRVEDLAARRAIMNVKKRLSRRKFVSSAVSASAISVLPGAQKLLGGFTGTVDARELEQNSVALITTPAWRDQGILNLANSPYAKLHSVPVHAVTIEDGFWSKRRETNVKSSIPTMRDQLLEHGRMDNFRRLVGKSSEPQKGPVYSDSDIYKWMEAVGFALQSSDMPEVHNQTAATIKEVVAIAEPSGYINTYHVGDKVPQ